MNNTVVIVTYNRLSLLKECLSCVDKQNLKFNNVVIVDNKSTDGTTEYLKTLTTKYHIIFEEKNGGGAKGFCDGIMYVNRELQTDWILLIDDDAMLASDYLEKVVHATSLFPDVYAFSGSVMTEGSIDLTHRKRLVSGNDFKIVPVDKNCYLNEYFEYDLSSFCGLIFNTKLLKKIGYPKADYFIWYDDSEYSLRIRKYSKIININSTHINHKTIISTGSAVLNWRGYYGIRNCGDIIKRYGTKKQFLRFVRRIRLAQLKNYLFFLFTCNKQYSYNSQLYKDALEDLEQNKFGFNPKYHA